MAVVMLEKPATKEDLDRALEDYSSYIKITADIAQGIVLVGGEFHADTEKILLEMHQSRQDDIWGGGLDMTSGKFDCNAIVNLRAGKNDSTEILEPETRESFLNLCRKFLSEYEK